ncbi:hypothetical protein CKO36_03855 [Rhabdochromatium marinum]|nr:hypothetical protein [Rhabdochromatium marinum]
MSVLALGIALGLPWLTAVLWLQRLFSQPQPGRWPMLLGYGYLLGLLLTTLLLRVQAGLGLGLGFWPPTLVLSALAALALWLGYKGWRWPAAPIKRAPDTGPLSHTVAQPWASWLIGLLLLWLGVRVLGLALELWWRPLFPWDAWTTWAVRAQVWVQARELVPFIAPDLWLQQPLGAAYALQAWDYPATVSLLATWPGLALGAWSDRAANLPWLGSAMALALAFVGQARAWGASVLSTLLFLWLLFSLPMLDTHIALAGYADLWLATALGMSFFAFLHWVRTNDRRQGLLALMLAFATLLMKHEGAVWIGLFLPALLVARRPPVWLLGVIAGIGLALVAIWFSGGVQLSLPLLGEVILSPTQLQVPGIGSFRLALSGSWQPVLYHLFVLDNWHLLGALVPAALVLAVALMWRDRADRALRAGVLWVLSALSAVYVLFFWTDASAWVLQGTSVNRILLQFSPALLFWMLTLWLLLRHQSKLLPPAESSRA